MFIIILPDGDYEGCYDLNCPQKVKNITHTYEGGTVVTPDNCTFYCATEEYQYAAIRNKEECSCFDDLACRKGKRLDDLKCGVPCFAGTSPAFCGGRYQFAVYRGIYLPKSTVNSTVLYTKLRTCYILAIFFPIYLFICLFIYSFIYLLISYLFIYLLIHLFTYFIFVYLFIHLLTYFLFVYLFYSFIYLLISYLFIYLHWLWIILTITLCDLAYFIFLDYLISDLLTNFIMYQTSHYEIYFSEIKG